MVVQLDLTEKMIASFNDCTKKGDYRPFMEENGKFIRTLCENLKKVRFDKNDTISSMVSTDLAFYLNYLTQWNPRDAHSVVRGVKLLEKYTPSLTDSLKNSITSKDWSKFYSEYFPTADFMIKEARNQNIFDFQIWYGSSSYDTFEYRDFVAQSLNQNECLPPVPTTESRDSRNDRGMIRFVGPDAEKHRANQNSHTNFPRENSETYRSTDGVTNVPVYEDPEIDDKWKQNQNSPSYQQKEVRDISHGQNFSQTTPRHQQHSQSLQQDSKSSPGYEGSTEPEFAPPKRKARGSSPGIPLSKVQPSHLNRSQYDRSIGLNPHGHPENRISSVLQNPGSHQFPYEHHGSSRPFKTDQHAQSPYPFNSVQKKTPAEEYIPAFSAEQELKSLRPPETNIAHTAGDNLDQQISKHRDEIEKSSELRPRYIFESTSPRTADSPRETSQCRDSPLDNRAFERELAEIKRKNALELEEKKKERQNKQREFEEEFRKLKEESRKRFAMLLQCIQAKHRFEVQEEKWKNWIQGCKQNLNTFSTRWNDFVDEVERDQKGLRRPDKIDHWELQITTANFLESVMLTYNIMQLDFENLKKIESTYPDALFVRVLMKCIADVAGKLLEFYNMAENLGSSQSKYLSLQSELRTLTPNAIYSTDQLRSICKTANSSNYHNIVFPELKQSLKIQEIY